MKQAVSVKATRVTRREIVAAAVALSAGLPAGVSAQDAPIKNGTKSLDQKALAKFIRENEHKTIAGNVKYNRLGEWAESRVLLVQFSGIKDKDVEQFRSPGKQVILTPDKYKTGQLKYPYENARKQGT